MASSPPKIIDLPTITFPRPGVEFNAWARTHRHKVVDELKERGFFMAKYEMVDENRSDPSKASKEILDRLAKANSGKPDFDIPEATTDEGIKKFIPSIKERQTILGYTRTAEALEEKVRDMVLEHCKLRKESTGYIFRMMKNTEEVRLGCSDNANRIEFLAVLDLNQVDSLDMKYNGKQFKIHVKPSTFLIMAGKPLKDWSKGEIPPLGLQVKMHGEKEKYSVGLFSYCKKQVGSSSGS